MGKGDTSISKKHKWKKEDKLTKLLSRGERSIIQLQERAGKFETDKQNDRAHELINYYARSGVLSREQWYAVRDLNLQKVKIIDRVHVYAMGAGDKVKIGISADPGGRRSKMQVGNPDDIQILWTIGPVQRGHGEKLERQLHRKCKKHHVRGEWFDQGCMSIVRDFTIKQQV